MNIVQADRDALLRSGHPLSQWSFKAIATGEWDHHHLVQAFARHRIEMRWHNRLWRWLRRAVNT